MIQANGRYRNSKVVSIPVGTSPRQVITPSPPLPYTFSYTSHMWTGYDRLDTLSTNVYGDPGKWWAIAAGNPEILDWHVIRVGTIIRIPNL